MIVESASAQARVSDCGSSRQQSCCGRLSARPRRFDRIAGCVDQAKLAKLAAEGFHHRGRKHPDLGRDAAERRHCRRYRQGLRATNLSPWTATARCWSTPDPGRRPDDQLVTVYRGVNADCIAACRYPQRRPPLAMARPIQMVDRSSWLPQRSSQRRWDEVGETLFFWFRLIGTDHDFPRFDGLLSRERYRLCAAACARQLPR